MSTSKAGNKLDLKAYGLVIPDSITDDSPLARGELFATGQTVFKSALVQTGARAAISLTTTGTSGTSTYNSTTGVLNIPSYTGGGGSLPTLTAGSVVFSDGTTLAQDNTMFFWDDTNNRLGIGSNTPQTPLQVMHTPSAFVSTQLVGNSPSTNLLDDYPALAIINTNTTANNYAGIDFYDNVSPASQWASAAIKAIWTTHGTSNATSRADLAFVTNGADGFNARLRITSAGLINISGLTASQSIQTDASKNLVSVANTGTGSNVLATAPTIGGLVLSAGTATAGTAPLKLTSGTNTTTAVPGQLEYNGTILTFTPTGTTRQTFAYLGLAQTFTATQTFTAPVVGTQTAGNNTTIAASTAFVQAANLLVAKDTNILNQTANRTLTIADWATSGELTIYANATAAGLTITLPTAALMAGYTLNVIKTDASANGITISLSGTNINGAASVSLTTAYQTTTIKSNGTQFYQF